MLYLADLNCSCRAILRSEASYLARGCLGESRELTQAIVPLVKWWLEIQCSSEYDSVGVISSNVQGLTIGVFSVPITLQPAKVSGSDVVGHAKLARTARNRLRPEGIRELTYINMLRRSSAQVCAVVVVSWVSLVFETSAATRQRLLHGARGGILILFKCVELSQSERRA